MFIGYIMLNFECVIFIFLLGLFNLLSHKHTNMQSYSYSHSLLYSTHTHALTHNQPMLIKNYIYIYTHTRIPVHIHSHKYMFSTNDSKVCYKENAYFPSLNLGQDTSDVESIDYIRALMVTN